MDFNSIEKINNFFSKNTNNSKILSLKTKFQVCLSRTNINENDKNKFIKAILSIIEKINPENINKKNNIMTIYENEKNFLNNINQENQNLRKIKKELNENIKSLKKKKNFDNEKILKNEIRNLKIILYEYIIHKSWNLLTNINNFLEKISENKKKNTINDSEFDITDTNIDFLKIKQILSNYNYINSNQNENHEILNYILNNNIFNSSEDYNKLKEKFQFINEKLRENSENENQKIIWQEDYLNDFEKNEEDFKNIKNLELEYDNKIAEIYKNLLIKEPKFGEKIYLKIKEDLKIFRHRIGLEYSKKILAKIKHKNNDIKDQSIQKTKDFLFEKLLMNQEKIKKICEKKIQNNDSLFSLIQKSGILIEFLPETLEKINEIKSKFLSLNTQKFENNSFCLINLVHNNSIQQIYDIFDNFNLFFDQIVKKTRKIHKKMLYNKEIIIFFSINIASLFVKLFDNIKSMGISLAKTAKLLFASFKNITNKFVESIELSQKLKETFQNQSILINNYKKLKK